MLGSVIIITLDVSFSNDKPHTALVIGHDITQRKNIEEKLRLILDTSRDTVLGWNIRNGYHEHVSPSIKNLTGYSVEEYETMDRRTVLGMIHPDDLAPLRASFVALNEKGEAEAEYRQQTKDGYYVWLSNHMSIAKDAEGRPLYLTGSIRNVTEQKRVEEALDASRKQYTELVETSNSIIMRVNRDLKITYMNEFGLRFFGYTREEVLGQNVVGTTIPRRDDADRDLAMMVEDIVERPREYATNVHQNMRKNGELVWVSWTNSFTYRPDGSVDGVLAVGNDPRTKARCHP